MDKSCFEPGFFPVKDRQAWEFYVSGVINRKGLDENPLWGGAMKLVAKTVAIAAHELEAQLAAGKTIAQLADQLGDKTFNQAIAKVWQGPILIPYYRILLDELANHWTRGEEFVVAKTGSLESRTHLKRRLASTEYIRWVM